jgi:tRNA (guanine10-N2)-methyltransferase
MPLYLLRVPLSHLTFRIPSLLSVAQLYGFEIRFVSTDLYRSVLIVELEKEEHVQHLLDRAILLQSADIPVIHCTC